MTRINLANRKNETRNSVTRKSVTWGRAVRNNAGPLVFAAVLIVCSLAVGCSSDKAQPITSNNPAPVAPTSNTVAANTVPAPLPEAKPAPKKVIRKRPATLTYSDKTYGISFAYPRRYALETGDAATALLMSSPVPMNFVQPGGVALAAVELPDSVYADTDLSYAFFTVSVHPTLTADQCQEFSVPQTPAPQTAAQSNSTPPQENDASTAVKTDSNTVTQSATLDPKLILGDLELHSAEAVSGEGTRQADSKYFHVYENGACYEFALNLTTNGQATDGTLKHVDRDRVFARLESILSTVKIEPSAADQGKTVAEQNDVEKSGTEKLSAEMPDAAKADSAKPSADGNSTAKPEASTPGGVPSAAASGPAEPAPVAASAPSTPPAPSAPPQ